MKPMGVVMKHLVLGLVLLVGLSSCKDREERKELRKEKREERQARRKARRGVRTSPRYKFNPEHMKFYKRGEACFAVVASRRRFWFATTKFNMAYVPCGKVEKYLEK